MKAHHVHVDAVDEINQQQNATEKVNECCFWLNVAVTLTVGVMYLIFCFFFFFFFLSYSNYWSKDIMNMLHSGPSLIIRLLHLAFYKSLCLHGTSNQTIPQSTIYVVTCLIMLCYISLISIVTVCVFSPFEKRIQIFVRWIMIVNDLNV